MLALPEHICFLIYSKVDDYKTRASLRCASKAFCIFRGTCIDERRRSLESLLQTRKSRFISTPDSITITIPINPAKTYTIMRNTCFLGPLWEIEFTNKHHRLIGGEYDFFSDHHDESPPASGILQVKYTLRCCRPRCLVEARYESSWSMYPKIITRLSAANQWQASGGEWKMKLPDSFWQWETQPSWMGYSLPSCKSE